jgi:hypothetical protein
MDRFRANSNIRSGLVLTALAVFMFGLTFYVAVIFV